MKGVGFIGFSESLNKALLENDIFSNFILKNIKSPVQKDSLKKSIEFLNKNNNHSVKPVTFLKTISEYSRDFISSPLTLGEFIENVAFVCDKRAVINEVPINNAVSNKKLKDSIKSLEETNVSNRNALFQILNSVKCRDCDFETYYFKENSVIDCSGLRKDLGLLENIERGIMAEEYIYIECKNCGKEFTTTEHIIKKTMSCIGEYLVFISEAGDKRYTFDASNTPVSLNLWKYCEMVVSECEYTLGALCENIAVYKKKY